MSDIKFIFSSSVWKKKKDITTIYNCSGVHIKYLIIRLRIEKK